MLHGKKILLGVTGGIAAYKAAQLTRLLVKAGAEMKVMMTEAAREFITPLTLGTLSKHPVLSDLVADRDSGEWNNHVHLGLWADLFLIAPATANTLAKMAHGESDNLLLATYLSARCPVYFAPAMDLDMYKHPATQENIKTLQERGNVLIPPGTGELASGLYGEGRMAEPEHILDFLLANLHAGLPLSGRTVLVTAGPTHESIDPVRYIANRSSGKMGFALAEAAAALGAQVHLVTGPTSLTTDCNNIHRWDVISAEEMYQKCVELFPKCDAAVLSAAVADFTPVKAETEKIKKADRAGSIQLKETKDILKSLGQIKKKGQVLCGFALETENELANARGKLKSKNLDLVVMNSLKDEGAGFGHDTNKVTLLHADGSAEDIALKQKAEVAADIMDRITRKIHA